jgi:hypothetical protein
MQNKGFKTAGLEYLKKKPKRLNWKVIAGPPGFELSSLQEYDLIFDEFDLRMRKLDTEENLKALRRNPKQL